MTHRQSGSAAICLACRVFLTCASQTHYRSLDLILACKYRSMLLTYPVRLAWSIRTFPERSEISLKLLPQCNAQLTKFRKDWIQILNSTFVNQALCVRTAEGRGGSLASDKTGCSNGAHRIVLAQTSCSVKGHSKGTSELGPW